MGDASLPIRVRLVIVTQSHAVDGLLVSNVQKHAAALSSAGIDCRRLVAAGITLRGSRRPDALAVQPDQLQFRDGQPIPVGWMIEDAYQIERNDA